MSTQEKKAERADIDVPPKPEEFGLDPQDFQDIQEKTLEKKEIQDHQQMGNVQTLKRHGPKCIVNAKSRKVLTPEHIKLSKNVVFRPCAGLPSDDFYARKVMYGTEEALKKLAQNHGSEELKIGIHGVFTDLKFAEIFLDPKAEEDLASGSFGDVTVGEGPSGLIKYVRKKIKKDKFHPTEVILTNKARHTNIIQSYGLLINFRNVEMIMEFAGQSLHSMVERKASEKKRGALDIDVILSLVLDICSGLDFLESRNVIHLDLKPRNLFVQGDKGKGYLLKIGDFGSAYMPGDTYKMVSCTPAYCAPEMAQLYLKRTNTNMILQSQWELEQRLQPKTDIFSAGLVVGFMHKGDDLLSLLYKEMKNNISNELESNWIFKYLADSERYQNSYLIPEKATQEMKKILEGMLNFEVKKRYSAIDSLGQIKALLSSGHREQNTMMSRSFVGIHGENLGKLGVRSRDVGKKEKPQSSTSETLLLTDGQLEGLPTIKKKIRLPTKGYQTGCFKQGDQIASSTREFNQASVALPLYDVEISDNRYPICQATDD